METVGVLLIVAGIWTSYCGIFGLDPATLAVQIVQNPAAASTVIQTARQDATAKLKAAAAVTGDAGSNGGILGARFNPFAAFPVSDGFGARNGEHKGIDYEMPVGTPLVAVSAGVLTNSSNAAGGYIATIKADNGWTFQYMHLSKYATSLNGKRVAAGKVPIGYSGGQAGAEGAGDSTGPHCHFQVNDPNGTPVDPNLWFSGKVD